MKKLACHLCLFLLLSLITYHLSLITIYAAAPDPQPCKNPKETELVNNYILNDNGQPPIVLRDYQEVSGREGDIVDLPPKSFSYAVDFSKLQAIFGSANSNYLEGDFQDDDHRKTDLLGTRGQQLNEYNRGVQKTTPNVVINEQKVDYVKYVNEHNTLPEAGSQYTDIENKGDPKTVDQLVSEYGIPTPPDAKSTEEEKEQWGDTWGKYWAKIPTSWNEFHKAEIWFHKVAGQSELAELRDPKDGGSCPLPINDRVNFVMPEFYRTTAIADQVNRNIVPRVAQSYQDHGILTKVASTPNAITNFFSFCKKLLQSPSQAIQNIKKATSNLLDNIATPVYAQTEPVPCLKPLKKAKQGNAPYCPLPVEEAARLGSSVSCTNKSDDFKLETDNPNVVCTFTFSTGNVAYTLKEKAGDEPNEECTKNGDGTLSCNPVVYMIPNFRIPWLSAIWNSTLYSDEQEAAPYQQETGKPGVYSYPVPQAVSYEILPPSFEVLRKKCDNGDRNACKKLDEIQKKIDDCLKMPGGFTIIFKRIACAMEALNKALPGSVGNDNADPKQRFIAGTNVYMEFTRDCAYKPKALQEELGLEDKCKPQE